MRGFLGNSMNAAVYVAYEVGPPPFQIQIQAANYGGPQGFGSFATVQSPTGLGLFHASLALDAKNDMLDLVAYGIKPGNGTVAGEQIGVYFFQFDASSGAELGSPVELTANSEWTVGGLPSRQPGASNGRDLWPPGEYVGASALGQSATVAFPVNAGSGTTGGGTVTAAANITDSCLTQAFEITDNGDLWECSNCNCGGVTTAVSGCVSPFVTDDDVIGGPKAACAALCPTAGCGGALSCPITSSCTAPSASTAQGQPLAVASCNLNEVNFGAPPSDKADYIATANGSSSGQFVLAGATTTTAMTGSASLNASTNPPAAASGVEMSRIRLTPASFHAGGMLAGTVSNVLIQNATRARGTFTDAQHFTIPAGEAKFIVSLAYKADGTNTASNLNLIVWNPSPLVGTLNAATNALTLQGNASDGAGNSVAVNFSGGLMQKIQSCPDPTSVVGGLLGFESLDWSTNGSPVLSLVQSPITEGCHALSVRGQGYIPINGPSFDTTKLTLVGPAVSLDVFVPPSQPNPSYLGAVQLYLTCPSANFFNQYIGEDELTGLPTNQYSTLRYPLPAPISAMLAGSHPDCFFSINLNINQTPTPMFLDNLRSTQ